MGGCTRAAEKADSAAGFAAAFVAKPSEPTAHFRTLQFPGEHRPPHGPPRLLLNVIFRDFSCSAWKPNEPAVSVSTAQKRRGNKGGARFLGRVIRHGGVEAQGTARPGVLAPWAACALHRRKTAPRAGRARTRVRDENPHDRPE